jgi:hypothetical protein
MTEAEWLACAEMVPLWEYLEYRNLERNHRKVRLFACACCRRAWPLLTDPRSRDAVEAAEGYVDQRITPEELSAHSEAAWKAVNAARRVAQRRAAEAVVDATGPGEPTPCGVSFMVSKAIARNAAAGRFSESQLETRAEWHQEQKVHAALTRDIFGNPFRPVSIDLTWLTPTVTNLAAAADEERMLPSGELDPARLAVLADVLEDAGCAERAILDHLRSPGPHARGCYAVDLILSKE